MALERVFSKKEMTELKSQIAVSGTDAYKSLDAIPQSTIDGAANLAARMVTEYVPAQEFENQKKMLTDGLDPTGVKFIDHVISSARQKVEKALENGSTIATTDGLVLWNREEKLSAATTRALEETGYDLSRSNMAGLQEYFNYGRVFGALDYEGKAKKLGSKDIEKMVDSIMAEHQTSGERTGQKIRKITQITGTTLGMAAFGLPLAVIGGTGGFIVGGLRKLAHGVTGRDDRDAVRALRMGYNQSYDVNDVRSRREAIREYKGGSRIGKGILWGAGGLGALGAMAASGFGKGLASIGMGDKKEEIEAQRIAIRAGIEEGLKSRGIGIEEKGKGKDKGDKEDKTLVKDGAAQRLASDDERAYTPGEYYYDSDEAKRKEMLAEIAGALGVEKNKLIENYFRPPQDNQFVNIEAESLKKLGDKKAVVAPGFAETDQALEEQKLLMESYKHSLEKQGRSDIEVVQIKVEGSKTPQWSVVGKDLTAAQVSFAKEMDDEGSPQISVMPKKDQGRAAVSAAAETAAASVPSIKVEAAPEMDKPVVFASQQQLEKFLDAKFKEFTDVFTAQLEKFEIGVKGGDGVSAAAEASKLAKSITIPETKQAEVQEKTSKDLAVKR